MRSLWLLASIVALSGVVGCGDDWQTGPGFAEIHFAAAASPALYVHYEKGKLQVAETAAGLASAKEWPVEKTERKRYEGGRVRTETRHYREAPLPFKVPGFTGAFVLPRLHFTWDKQAAQKGRRYSAVVWQSLSCALRFTHRDRAGTWTYTTDSTTELSSTAKKAARHATREPLPDPKQLALDVEARPKEGAVGVGVHLRSNGAIVLGLRLNGKSAPMRITIKDSHGKTVHTHTGNVDTFGFT